MIFQYRPADSWFHRIDPLSKLIWLACVSVVAIRYETAWLQSVLLFTIAFTGIVLARINLGAIWRGLQFPIWFGIPYFVLQLLLLPGETEIGRIGRIIVTYEALDFSAAVSIRLLTLVLASFIFIVSTDPRDVVLAMSQKVKIPYRFAFAVSIALRFLPVLEAEAEQIRSAGRLRGLGKPAGFRGRIAAWKRFAAAVFTNAVRRVQMTADAMDARAFGISADRTYLRELRIPAAGIALSIASGLTAVILFVYV